MAAKRRKEHKRDEVPGFAPFAPLCGYPVLRATRSELALIVTVPLPLLLPA